MVKVFRHAVSLDEVGAIEWISAWNGRLCTHHRGLSTPLHRLTCDQQHRAMFRPNLYHHPTDTGTINGVQETPSVLKRVWRGFKWVGNALNPFGVKVLNRRPDTAGSRKAPQFKTDALEVWFPGCHSGMYFFLACPPFWGGGGIWPVVACKSLTTHVLYTTDVGGGNTDDIDDKTGKLNPALANTSLRWMLRQVVAANQPECPVYFDEATLELWNIPTEDVQVQPLSAEGLPVAHYFRDEDVRVRKKDQLKLCRLWYILEIFPTYYEWQNEQGQWLKQWRQVIHPSISQLFCKSC